MTRQAAGAPLRARSWIAAGPVSIPLPRAWSAWLERAVGEARSGTPVAGRVVVQRWARLSIALPRPSETQAAGAREGFGPASEAEVQRWRMEGDRDAPQLRSAFRFWDHGLRRVFAWRTREGARAVVWVLTARDNARLRRLPGWAAMYPPLPADALQLENLFVFSDARARGAATSLVQGVFAWGASRGMRRAFTHIADRNAPALSHAARVGWTRYGTIARLQLDVPGLRRAALFLHLAGGGAGDAPVSEPAGPATTRRPERASWRGRAPADGSRAM